MHQDNHPNAGLVRSRPNAGVARSLVDFRGARLFFAAVAPREGETFAEQAQDALEKVGRFVLAEGGGVSIVGQSVFLAEPADRAEFHRMMSDRYGADLPATAYVAQPPGNGRRLAIELWGLRCGNEPIEIQRRDESSTLVIVPGLRLMQLADHYRIPPGRGVYDTALDAYRSIQRRLAEAGFRFDQLLRTWFFIGGITDPDVRGPRYEELNRARTDFYRDVRFAAGRLPRNWTGPVFPASSGVGAEGDDLTVCCLALDADRSDLVLFPLENPLQTPAFQYDPRFGEESPKFVRAMTATAGDEALILISGTAGITAADSRHPEDIQRQTELTLDNIAALISSDNFRRHGFPGLGATLADLAVTRVYLKRPEDYGRVVTICRRRLGDLPTTFALCDLCRPELLVEIEGIAAARRRL